MSTLFVEVSLILRMVSSEQIEGIGEDSGRGREGREANY